MGEAMNASWAEREVQSFFVSIFYIYVYVFMGGKGHMYVCMYVWVDTDIPINKTTTSGRSINRPYRTRCMPCCAPSVASVACHAWPAGCEVSSRSRSMPLLLLL
jgi:hypothetical protein